MVIFIVLRLHTFQLARIVIITTGIWIKEMKHARENMTNAQGYFWLWKLSGYQKETLSKVAYPKQ